MRVTFKTDYAQDIKLAKHGGHAFWYGLLLAALLAAPWWAGEYVMSQLHFICIYSIVGFGLMMEGMARSEITDRVANMLKLVRLSAFGQR